MKRVKETFKEVKKIIKLKSLEYHNKSRLAGFYFISDFIDSTPIQICCTYILKHLYSILDITNNRALSTKEKRKINDKINDCIVYLIKLKELLNNDNTESKTN